MSMYGFTVYANGSRYEGSMIGKIVVYGHGVKLFERDDFEVYEIRQDKNGVETLSSVYGGSPVSISLAGEIKTARKENLNRCDNYVLPYSVDYFPRERRTALYIHESEIAVDDLGEVLAMQTKDEKDYLHAVRLSFRHPVTFQRLHAEHIPCDGSWTIPDGGRWSSGYGSADCPSYDTYDYTDSPLERARAKGKGVIKRWKTLETVESPSIISAFRYYSRIEYSADRKRRERIAEKLKAGGLRDFSHYDVEKLEKALGVTLEG